MRRGADKRSSDKLSVSAISQKSRSHAGGVIRGIGDRPNKQENVRFRESGDRAVFGLCHNTGIACYNEFDPERTGKKRVAQRLIPKLQ